MTWPKIEDVGGHEAPLEASLSVPSFVPSFGLRYYKKSVVAPCNSMSSVFRLWKIILLVKEMQMIAAVFACKFLTFLCENVLF